MHMETFVVDTFQCGNVSLIASETAALLLDKNTHLCARHAAQKEVETGIIPAALPQQA